MAKDQAGLGPLGWLLSAAVALVGSITLFNATSGINGGIWVALAVLATLASKRPANLERARPAMVLGIAAILAAGSAARTTDVTVHVGIFWLTALMLAAFLVTISSRAGAELRLITLLLSPCFSAARVVVGALREIGLALRAATDRPSRPAFRRILLVAPVVLLLLFLFGGADPLIHSAIESIGVWIPRVPVPASTPFFVFLFLVMLGAASRLPDLNFGLPEREIGFRIGPNPKDGMILVGSTLATLFAFLALQAAYLFIRLPGQIGSGVTYAEYARRGFGQLCVVVTIVVAVIILAERMQGADGLAQSRILRKLEFALIAAAALILLSAQRRVVLYEAAYGYTIARVHATAYIVFLSVFLILLALELRQGAITKALGLRSAAFALVVVLAILYWNDQGWIMDRNIDRVRVTGKFDEKYAAGLSSDAFPVLIRRRNELPPAAWTALEKTVACKTAPGPIEWYEWNAARSAASSAREAAHLAQPSKCPATLD